MSLRDQILAQPDLQLVPVHVPEWGLTAYLKPLTLEQRIAIQPFVRDEKELTLRLAILALSDADGTPVFTAADRPTLEARNGAVLQRLARQVLRLGLEDIEDREKN